MLQDACATPSNTSDTETSTASTSYPQDDPNFDPRSLYPTTTQLNSDEPPAKKRRISNNTPVRSLQSMSKKEIIDHAQTNPKLADKAKKTRAPNAGGKKVRLSEQQKIQLFQEECVFLIDLAHLTLFVQLIIIIRTACGFSLFRGPFTSWCRKEFVLFAVCCFFATFCEFNSQDTMGVQRDLFQKLLERTNFWPNSFVGYIGQAMLPVFKQCWSVLGASKAQIDTMASKRNHWPMVQWNASGKKWIQTLKFETTKSRVTAISQDQMIPVPMKSRGHSSAFALDILHQLDAHLSLSANNSSATFVFDPTKDVTLDEDDEMKDISDDNEDVDRQPSASDNDPIEREKRRLSNRQNLNPSEQEEYPWLSASQAGVIVERSENLSLNTIDVEFKHVIGITVLEDPELNLVTGIMSLKARTNATGTEIPGQRTRLLSSNSPMEQRVLRFKHDESISLSLKLNGDLFVLKRPNGILIRLGCNKKAKKSSDVKASSSVGGFGLPGLSMIASSVVSIEDAVQIFSTLELIQLGQIPLLDDEEAKVDALLTLCSKAETKPEWNRSYSEIDEAQILDIELKSVNLCEFIGCVFKLSYVRKNGNVNVKDDEGNDIFDPYPCVLAGAEIDSRPLCAFVNVAEEAQSRIKYTFLFPNEEDDDNKIAILKHSVIHRKDNLRLLRPKS